MKYLVMLMKQGKMIMEMHFSRRATTGENRKKGMLSDETGKVTKTGTIPKLPWLDRGVACAASVALGHGWQCWSRARPEQGSA